MTGDMLVRYLKWSISRYPPARSKRHQTKMLFTDVSLEKRGNGANAKMRIISRRWVNITDSLATRAVRRGRGELEFHENPQLVHR